MRNFHDMLRHAADLRVARELSDALLDVLN